MPPPRYAAPRWQHRPSAWIWPSGAPSSRRSRGCTRGRGEPAGRCYRRGAGSSLGQTVKDHGQTLTTTCVGFYREEELILRVLRPANPQGRLCFRSRSGWEGVQDSHWPNPPPPPGEDRTLPRGQSRAEDRGKAPLPAAQA